ncbi:MAG: rhomboid family intramembrane serine protease [Anaerolineae bacterium]|nr:rhomboid family intramembrane serine protease [Anaerolineae bacterium]HNS39839.1 rhomboid family intramembrane serine protease [Promineifilum sp.]
MNTPEYTLQDTLRFYGEDAKRRLKPLLTFIIALWLIEIIDQLFFGGALDGYGIIPRQLIGLRGIFFAPLLHGDFAHLLANTAPFLILGFLVMARHEEQFPAITVLIIIISGLGTWLIAPSNTVHVGASGLIFGYFAYLIVNAWYERSLAAIALAILVLALYGGLLAGVLPANGVSWQGHLFGIVGGVAAAYYYSGPRQI